jgi:hypothetical protein
MTVEGLRNTYRKLRTKMDSKIWPIVMASSAAGLIEFFCSCYINFWAIKWSCTMKMAPGRVLMSEMPMKHTIEACSGAMPATTWKITKQSFLVLDSVILMERNLQFTLY